MFLSIAYMNSRIAVCLNVSARARLVQYVFAKCEWRLFNHSIKLQPERPNSMSINESFMERLVHHK